MSDANKQPGVMITGAAKRLGATVATHVASQGRDLCLHYHRSGDAAETLADTLRRAHGVQVILKQADLADPAALADFWAGLPACDTLILNAATYERDSLADMQPATLRHQLAVNLESPLVLAQGFMAQLPAGASGSISILGDGTLGWSVSPHFFSYAVSKHAWASVIELLAAAVAPRARANLIALAPTLPNPGEDDMFLRLADRAPLKRTGSPEELLAALDYLQAAPGVTGQVLSLANGMHLAPARPA